MKDVLGENAPSYATIKNWVAEFKRGHTSTQDEHLPGRPKSATTPEISNTTDFLRRFVTTDETWVHHYIPESKIQSKQWTEKGSPAPKKAKAVKSVGKVMASVFWNSKGILMIDYLPKGQNINGEYYADLLDKLQVCIPQKFLGGQRFENNSEVMSAVDSYFEGLEENHFRDGIKALEHRWMKCIALQELKDPVRNLPRAIAISCTLVTVVYTFTNIAFYTTLSPTEVLGSAAVAVTFAERLFGWFALSIPLFVAASTFGAVNGVLLTSSRERDTAIALYSAVPLAERIKHYYNAVSTPKQSQAMYSVVLRGRGAGADAGDADDGVAARHARARGAGRGAAVAALPHRLRHLRAHQLRRIRHMGSLLLSIGAAVLCLPVLRYTQPNLERPIKVNLFFPDEKKCEPSSSLDIKAPPARQPPGGFIILSIFSGRSVAVDLLRWSAVAHRRRRPAAKRLFYRFFTRVFVLSVKISLVKIVFSFV
ncbi:unnamed protein product [Diatraea saccharalis]|uniref:Uncharacterized protein n=1 Tax=Diatraea saccharalis TaxID=40085 RepID=A0A9N9RDI0_9NEOP|nr:unnamed protein product [Diatraea saccharalis]